MDTSKYELRTSCPSCHIGQMEPFLMNNDKGNPEPLLAKINVQLLSKATGFVLGGSHFNAGFKICMNCGYMAMYNLNLLMSDKLKG